MTAIIVRGIPGPDPFKVSTNRGLPPVPATYFIRRLLQGFQADLARHWIFSALYGANILSVTRNRNSRLPVVFVDDSSQDISSTNGSSCVPYWPGHRKVLTNALVRTSMVVVFSVLFENAVKVALIQDQDRVQTLLANQAHPPFSESICPGSLIGGVNDLDPFRRKHGIER
jgi:hypothetical protein